ncbi:DUF262 domain-containing protein [Bacteroidetes/Chlorobi group bacterium ChocPot_Mid]|jgi:hypothetical protein|nr:MAG: DUF262 domain-containing protein [Bacteroidetes/Chlorobi group bacterium ChocPot_Mid]
MKTQKYSVNQHLIETILSYVKAGEIAIPEIQRPFVWEATKVRDLMDSLYQGYPIGYLIAWKNPDVKLKDGTIADGKKILIDGQQRVTALSAAILGNYVINKEYQRVRIKISFNPIKEQFEVFNTAIEKDHSWIADVSYLFLPDTNVLTVVEDYCLKNEISDRMLIFNKINNLIKIVSKQIGLIELDSDLDIEVVTEIFIRINSQGVVLSQADFAMSKIAANDTYGGSTLRKCIDYFCHLAVAPEFYNYIVDVDKDFTSTDYFKKMAWLRNENEDIYDPKYTDLLRVAFTSEFNRGKLSDLVSLLSGRNFEARTYEEEIEQQSYETLEKGILNFINETNFKRFVMIIKSAGFISSKLIRSQNALNFAYILYLKLRSQNYNQADIESYVRKWFVLCILTGRYSGSPESSFDYDIKNISSKHFNEYLQSIENAELSDAFWEFGLIQNLDTSVSSSPTFNVFLASQVKFNDKGFLSKDITVNDLITQKGDIHHIFPKELLKKNGLNRGQYNQIANYAFTQSEINIKIGKKSPNVYLKEIKEQCNGNGLVYGGITDMGILISNLQQNCIPDDIFEMNIDNYDDFLIKRRKLMAQKMKEYYLSL